MVPKADSADTNPIAHFTGASEIIGHFRQVISHGELSADRLVQSNAGSKMFTLFKDFLKMAAASTSDERSFIDLKDAYSSGKFPQMLKKFNISTIITYFLQTHSDFRSIREVSYELYTNGHVRVSKQNM